MIPVMNDIDRLLQDAPVRVLNPSNAAIILTPSGPGFHLNGSGEIDIGVITVQAELINVEGTLAWEVQGATSSNLSDRSIQIHYGGQAAVVTATLANGGEPLARSCIIPVLRDGTVGASSYVWIKYADGPNGEGLSNFPDGKAYIAIAQNKSTAVESDDPADYSYVLAKGSDGSSLRMWIKYSDSADGTDPYDDPSETTQYIGIAVNKSSATESTNKADYTWSKFRGADGVSVPGSRGAGFYKAYGTAWSDGVADAATPGGNVVGDIVVISNGTPGQAATVSYPKEWNGSTWEWTGAFLPGSLIVEETVFAAQLAVDAVTAEKIKAGAVTASHMTITTGSNLVPDGDMADLKWWGRWGQETYFAEGGGTGWKSNYAIKTSSINPGWGAFRDTVTPYFPIQRGATYRVEFQVYMSPDFDGIASFVWHLPMKAWHQMGGPSRGWNWHAGESGLPVMFDGGSPDKGSVRTFSAVVHMEEGNAYLTRSQFRMVTKVFAGRIEFGGVSVVRLADDALVVDGGIKARHISIDNLRAIAAYVGSMELGPGGNIRQGMTDYAQGVGFFVGEHAGLTKLIIGDPNGAMMWWDGSKLQQRGIAIENPTIKNDFSVWCDPAESTGNPGGAGTKVVVGSGAHVTSGSGSYAYTWTFSGSPQMRMISSPSAGYAQVEVSASSGWFYGTLSLTIRDLNTGAIANADAYVRVQIGAVQEP